MEVKVIKPQVSVSPDSQTSNQNSRHLRLIQYLAKTVSGSTPRQPHNTQSPSPNGEAGELQNASDSEESGDEEVHVHASHNPSSPVAAAADTGRRLLRKLSHGIVGMEPSYGDGDKTPSQSEGTHAWGVSKTVYEVSKGVAADLKGSLGRLLEMKSMLIEKLSSMPTIPVDSLEHARHSIESIISDATQSAYGKTKDAMWRIRVKLVEIIPSLSPHETKKIVDDVECKVNNMSKVTSADDIEPDNAKAGIEDGRVAVPASTASVTIAPQPTSGFVASMDRVKAWALLRSRL